MLQYRGKAATDKPSIATDTISVSTKEVEDICKDLILALRKVNIRSISDLVLSSVEGKGYISLDIANNSRDLNIHIYFKDADCSIINISADNGNYKEFIQKSGNEDLSKAIENTLKKITKYFGNIVHSIRLSSKTRSGIYISSERFWNSKLRILRLHDVCNKEYINVLIKSI